MPLSIREKHRAYATAQEAAALAAIDSDLATDAELGAGGPSRVTVHDRPATAHACDDEFEDLTGQSGAANGLAGKWSLRTLTSGAVKTAAEDVRGGCLIDGTGGNQPSGAWGMEQAFAPSGDFTAVLKYGSDYASEREMIGLYAVTSDGDGYSVVIDNGDQAYIRRLTAHATAGFATPTPVNPGYPANTLHRAVIRRVGNVWYGGFLADDVAQPKWARFATNTETLTVAKIGIGRVFGSGACRVFVDYLRVTEP